MSRLLTLVIVILFLFSSIVLATTIHVPADHPTIQDGILNASEGDTVLVADGTYIGDGNRDIQFYGRNLVLMSENGPEVTIIDCQADVNNQHRGIQLNNKEDSTSKIIGFTIRNGFAEHLRRMSLGMEKCTRGNTGRCSRRW